MDSFALIICPIHWCEIEQDSVCPACLRDDPPSSVLRVGDRMRISVELIRQIAAESDGTSPLVTVSLIKRQDDGTVLLTMSRVEA
jgi:hypothetical protein